MSAYSLLTTNSGSAAPCQTGSGQQLVNSSLSDSQQSASGSSSWWFWVQQSFVTATTYGHLQQPDNSSVHYRGNFTLWTVLALLAPFIYKADLVIPPVQSIVLAVDPFPLAFASANFLHGLSHLPYTYVCVHVAVHMHMNARGTICEQFVCICL